MNRDEALRTLRLDAEHDAHAVEQSYWSLVRRAQSQDDEHASQREIERLNAAYGLLAPAPEPQMVTANRRTPSASHRSAGAAAARRTPSQTDGMPEAVLAWLAAEGVRVQRRWRGRAAEAGALFGAVIVLAVLALAAGAAFAVVLVCTAIAAAIVWAPWRSAEHITHDDQ